MSRTRFLPLIKHRFPGPRGRFRVAAGLLILASILACGDDTEEPNPQNVTRLWHVVSCEYVNAADGAQRVDLVAAGWVIDLHINDNGAFRYSFTPPGEALDFYDGQWRIDGSELVLTRTGSPFSWSFEVVVQEEAMSMSGADAEYDFDADGSPEAATWNLDLRT